MIAVAGSARVKPLLLSDLLATATSMAAASRNEPGCVEYRFLIDIDESDVVRLFECCEDQHALDRHFGTEHFAACSAAIANALVGAPEFSRYEVTSAGPLFG